MHPPRQVLPRVWIGPYTAAVSADFVRQNNIRLIINCTRHVPSPFADTIPTYRVPVDDAVLWSGVMAQHLPIVVGIMARHLRTSSGDILVHCHAGISRSSTVVAAYLVLEQGMSARDAIRYIQAKKPETFRPAPVFFQTLDHL